MTDLFLTIVFGSRTGSNFENNGGFVCVEGGTPEQISVTFSSGLEFLSEIILSPSED